jgi:type I restriction enzyme S subunit
MSADAIDSLPEGWASTPLADIAASIQYGYTASARTGGSGPRFLRITDIQDGEVTWDDVPSCQIEPRDIEVFQLAPGDIVFARTGATTGKSYLIRSCPESVFASYLIRVRAHSLVEPSFLHLCFQTKHYWGYISDNVAGNAQPNCNASKLAALPLTIPPLAEQKRIVAKVEALLARVNAAREKLARVPQILKRFRQAVLAAACSGRLTEDWRADNPNALIGQEIRNRLRALHESHGCRHGGKAADPSEGVHDLDETQLPEEWAIVELKWLCSPDHPITYGILKPGPDQPDGVPYVRVADFPKDRINLAGVKRTTKEIAHEYRRSTLHAGDVLLSIRGTAGRVCRVPPELDGANITQDTARIAVCDLVDANYVEWYLRAPSTQHRLERAMKGVAVRGVNIGDVRVLQIAMPSREEQQQIVNRIDALFRLANAIERRLAVATKRAEKLTQAILAKAFRGELVPTEAELAQCEGRDYEPASALLERVRAERGVQENNGRSSPRAPRRRRGSVAKHDGQTSLPSRAKLKGKVPAVGLVQGTEDQNGRAESPPKHRQSAQERNRERPRPDGADTRHELDDEEIDEFMAAFRSSCWGDGDMTQDDLLREVANQFGYERVGKEIRARLKNHLRAAIRRRIIARDGQFVYCPTKIFRNYERADLVRAVRAVMRSGTEYDREEVARAVARYLGYSQLSSGIRSGLKSIFNGMLRRGMLDRRGARGIVRTS